MSKDKIVEPVKVTWMDHCGDDGNWVRTNYIDNNLVEVTSCGYLLLEDKTAVTLIMSLTDNGLGSATLTIGKKLIKSIEYLKVKPRKK